MIPFLSGISLSKDIVFSNMDMTKPKSINQEYTLGTRTISPQPVSRLWDPAPPIPQPLRSNHSSLARGLLERSRHGPV
jgi:hypothetical protein